MAFTIRETAATQKHSGIVGYEIVADTDAEFAALKEIKENLVGNKRYDGYGRQQHWVVAEDEMRIHTALVNNHEHSISIELLAASLQAAMRTVEGWEDKDIIIQDANHQPLSPSSLTDQMREQLGLSSEQRAQG